MRHVRIVCRAPKLPPRADGIPNINGILPSLEDCEVTLVSDDGSEEPVPLTMISSITWRVSNDGGPTTATIEHIGVEVEVEGIVEASEPKPGE